jgi:ABC-2 type transport system permease protein
VRNIRAIFLKELRSYFTSPVAYVAIAIFLIVSGYFFYNIVTAFSYLSHQGATDPMLMRRYNLMNITESVVRPLFGNISMIMLLMMPLLTMRLISEEKKSGTLELLLTLPVTELEITLGKFFACVFVFTVMLLSTVTYPVLLFIYGSPELVPILTGYLGLFLLGVSFISLGLFCSSITENQIVSATLAFGALLIFWLISYSTIFVSPFFGKLLGYLAMTEHLSSLAKGVIDTEDIIYYLNFTVFFLFLTLRSLERRRWLG